MRIRRGADPDLIVRLPDGIHAAVAMSMTDYAGVTEPATTETQPLLALAGLRQIVQRIEQWDPHRRYDKGSST